MSGPYGCPAGELRAAGRGQVLGARPWNADVVARLLDAGWPERDLPRGAFLPLTGALSREEVPDLLGTVAVEGPGDRWDGPRVELHQGEWGIEPCDPVCFVEVVLSPQASVFWLEGGYTRALVEILYDALGREWCAERPCDDEFVDYRFHSASISVRMTHSVDYAGGFGFYELAVTCKYLCCTTESVGAPGGGVDDDDEPGETR